MSRSKKIVVLLIALTLTALTVPAAFAQVGGSNPSGGTGSAQRAVDEGSKASTPSIHFSGNVSLDLAIRSWLTSFVARIATAPRPGLASVTAATLPRRVPIR